MSYDKIVIAMSPIIQKIKSNRRIVIYGLVGASAFAVEYASFLLLIRVISGPYALSVAQTLSFSLGLIVSFTGSRLFTFNNKDATYTHSVTRQIGSYVVLAVTNLVITNVVIYGLVHYLALMPFVAKVLVMCMVVVWNFLIFQKIIFKSK